MPKFRLIFVLLMAIVATACGGGSMAAPHQPAMQVKSGNWVFDGTSTAVQGVRLHGGAGITAAGSVLLVDLIPLDSCFPVSPPPVAQATVSGNTVTVNATVGSATLTMQLTGTDTQLAGTYAIKGACGDDHGTITLTYVPPVAGTWTGQINRLDGSWSGATLTLKLTQAGSSLFGFYTLTGSADFQGSSCISSGVVSNGSPVAGTPPIPSYIAADSMMLFVSSGSNSVTVLGGLDGPTYDKTMHALVSSSNCTDLTGTAILTRQ